MKCLQYVYLTIFEGVKVLQKCEVQQIKTDGKKVTGVRTNRGEIDCRYFINATGLVSIGDWSTHQ